MQIQELMIQISQPQDLNRKCECLIKLMEEGSLKSIHEMFKDSQLKVQSDVKDIEHELMIRSFSFICQEGSLDNVQRAHVKCAQVFRDRFSKLSEIFQEIIPPVLANIVLRYDIGFVKFTDFVNCSFDGELSPISNAVCRTWLKSQETTKAIINFLKEKGGNLREVSPLIMARLKEHELQLCDIAVSDVAKHPDHRF